MTEPLPDWVDLAYQDGPDIAPKRGDLGPMFDWIFKRQSYERLNQVFRELDLTRLEPVHMIGLIRVTSQGWADIAEWSPLLIRIRDELLRRGNTPKTVADQLRGLFDDDGNPSPPRLSPSVRLVPMGDPPPREMTDEEFEERRKNIATAVSTYKDIDIGEIAGEALEKTRLALREMLLKAPETQLDPSMRALIDGWSNPVRAIELLEVVDMCVHGSLASGFVMKLLERELELALKREAISYESLLPLATWRKE